MNHTNYVLFCLVANSLKFKDDGGGNWLLSVEVWKHKYISGNWEGLLIESHTFRNSDTISLLGSTFKSLKSSRLRFEIRSLFPSKVLFS
jgi:hypothetical protein